MLSEIFQHAVGRHIFFWICAVSIVPIQSRAVSLSPAETREPSQWTSDVKLHRLPRSMRGTLTITAAGVDFQPEKGWPTHWSFADIRRVNISTPRRLSLVTYQNRHWHVPGDRTFEFKLKDAMPPEVAAELVRRVGKPAIDGDPVRSASGFASIAARHVTRTGGSEGVLRFRDSGIDYLSQKGGDARSWRWADIQTLAHPEPYRLWIYGYLETFDFELEQPLSEELFDRLWDHVYAQGLNIGQREGEMDEKNY
jgi:hypothetical protein